MHGVKSARNTAQGGWATFRMRTIGKKSLLGLEEKHIRDMGQEYIYIYDRKERHTGVTD